jgi:hypothetical protein
MMHLMHVHRVVFCAMLLLGYLSGALAAFAVFHFGVYGPARRILRTIKTPDVRAPSVHDAVTLAPPSGSSLYEAKTLVVRP